MTAVASRRNAAPAAERAATRPDLVDRLIEDWKRERPDLDFGAMAVVARALRVGGELDRRADRLLQPHGLRYSEFDVLATLFRSGPPHELSPTALQQAVVLTSGAMTALLRRLSDKGLIVRRRDSRDGRSFTAQLTRKGRHLAEKLIELRLEDAKRSVSGLSAREQAELAALLKKLGASLEA